VLVEENPTHRRCRQATWKTPPHRSSRIDSPRLDGPLRPLSAAGMPHRLPAIRPSKKTSSFVPPTSVTKRPCSRRAGPAQARSSGAIMLAVSASGTIAITGEGSSEAMVQLVDDARAEFGPNISLEALADGGTYIGNITFGLPSGEGVCLYPEGDAEGRIEYRGEFEEVSSPCDPTCPQPLAFHLQGCWPLFCVTPWSLLDALGNNAAGDVRGARHHALGRWHELRG
jgi:hypothetical protein